MGLLGPGGGGVKERGCKQLTPHFFSALAMIAIIFYFCSGAMSETTLMVALRVFSASMKST